MANKELKCTDNYSLPKGDRGPRGLTGPQGDQGVPGPGIAGPQGKQGGNKIDINLQSNQNPYIQLTDINQVDLAYFIFPGTTTFTPKTWRVAFSMVSKTNPNHLRVELGFINPDGSKQLVAGFTEIRQDVQPFYVVKEVSSFSFLPADPITFYISASVSLPSVPTGNVATRLYATEIRE